MKRVKHILMCLLLCMALTVGAFAADVPESFVCENLNGQQRIVKTYVLPPSADPDTLREAAFDYDGYHYTWAYTTKEEHPFLLTRSATETVKVETAKNELTMILEQLAPTIEYDDGEYRGELSLDHTTLHTEASGYWQVDGAVHDVTLEYAGQIIKLSAYDKPAELGVSITKRGNTSVMAGQQMKYTITVANTSNVALDNFFWHDRIPTDVATGTVLTTGTYSARLNYRVLYKTNYNGNYQVLASNLLTSNNYSFALNAIPTQAGEVVTDIYFDFGKVPVGFQSVTAPTLSVQVSGTAANGYTMVNRADVGGKYGGTWQTANASWATAIIRLGKTPMLPKTGY